MKVKLPSMEGVVITIRSDQKETSDQGRDAKTPRGRSYQGNSISGMARQCRSGQEEQWEMADVR